MSEKRMNDELAAVEAMLGSLTPAASSLDRDRLMFLAGRTSVERLSPPAGRRVTAWLWPCTTAAALLVAATLGLLWAGGRPDVVERVVYVSHVSSPAAFDFPPVAIASPSPDSPWENRRLCKLILEKGIDALPESNGRSTSDTPAVPLGESYRDLLNQFFNDPQS
jgi:hypothetical protein